MANTMENGSISEEIAPYSLENLSIKYILQNPGIIFYAIDDIQKQGTCNNNQQKFSQIRPKLKKRKTHSIEYEESRPVGDGNKRPSFQLHLHPAASGLPGQIYENILETLNDEGFELNDSVIAAFGDRTTSRLRSVQLRNSSITDFGLRKLLNHKIRSLDVSGCNRLTEKSLETINKHSGDTLLELKLCGNWSEYEHLENKMCLNNSILPKSLLLDPANELDQDSDSVDAKTILDLDEYSYLVNGRTPKSNKKGLESSSNPSEEAIEEELEASANHKMSSLDYEQRGYILNTTNLQKLSIYDIEVIDGSSYFDMILKSLSKLTHLDMSGCQHRDGMDEFKWLPDNLKNSLQSLTLFNMEEIDELAIENIVKLSKLKHLDISKHPDDIEEEHYRNPNSILALIVERLPDLMSLDISGTNLAGNGVFELEQDAQIGSNNINNNLVQEHEYEIDENNQMDTDPADNNVNPKITKCDIFGLKNRVNKPLHYLGLYKCPYQPNHRAHIPAKVISGDKFMAQILIAGQQYMCRPAYLHEILIDLKRNAFQMETKDMQCAIDLCISIMKRYPEEKGIQRKGSEFFYEALREESHVFVSVKTLRTIVSTLMNGLFYHKDDRHVLRSGIFGFLGIFQHHAKILLFECERFIQILLHIMSKPGRNDHNLELISVYYLNSLACEVETHQKLLVGDLGAIQELLKIIEIKLASNTCDEVLKTAWSTMWNVTDETPINCERFLKGSGMQLFLQCKAKFPESNSLLRNMMGLLGNIAEVSYLRPQLMTKAFVSEFATLLDSGLDGIEVSYNAAGVLAHMASDGPDAWTIEEPKREDVLGRMVKAVERWDLNAQRSINYRSFEPILRLLRVSHTFQCQLWSVWALANLTTVDNNKYCRIIRDEGGIPLIKQIVNGNMSPAPNSMVIEHASIVLENISTWLEEDSRIDSADDS